MSTNDTGGGAAAAAGTARDEAAGLAHAAADSGQDLLQDARGQAGDVLHEASDQARDLLGEARTGLQTQAAEQQTRAATGLRALGDELDRMAGAAQGGGLATDLVRQVAGRSGAVADWLEAREPGDVLHEVADFARRRPTTFLAIAVGAGVLAGRLTRGLTDAPDAAPSAAGPRRTTSSAPVVADRAAQVDDRATAPVVDQDAAPGTPQHRGPGPATADESPAWPPLASEEHAWTASGTVPAREGDRP